MADPSYLPRYPGDPAPVSLPITAVEVLPQSAPPGPSSNQSIAGYYLSGIPSALRQGYENLKLLSTPAVQAAPSGRPLASVPVSLPQAAPLPRSVQTSPVYQQELPARSSAAPQVPQAPQRIPVGLSRNDLEFFAKLQPRAPRTADILQARTMALLDQDYAAQVAGIDAKPGTPAAKNALLRDLTNRHINRMIIMSGRSPGMHALGFESEGE